MKPPVSTESKTGALSFEEVVEKHADFVYNVALRMTGDPTEAQDVMQEAFISAYRAFPKFRGESAITTWLYRITVNAALMKRRKEKKSKSVTLTGYEESDVEDWAQDPERAALDSELQTAIQDGLKKLPPDLRMAVVLRDVQGLSGEEAAQAQGVPVATLKTRLHRGRMLMRKHLDGYLRKK